MEMVRKEYNQTLLKDYYEGRDDGTKLRESISKEWAFTKDGPDQYLRIIEAAKNRGIRVMGGYPSLGKEETVRLEKTPEGMSEIVERIDRSLASVVEELPLGLRDKVATFSGAGHIKGGLKIQHAVPDTYKRENQGVDGLLNLPAVTFLQPLGGLNRPLAHMREGQYCIYIPETGQSKRNERLVAEQQLLDYLRSPNTYLFDEITNAHNNIADFLNKFGENQNLEAAIRNVASAHRVLQVYGREGKKGGLEREPFKRVAQSVEGALSALEKANLEKGSVIEEAHEILKGVKAFIAALEVRMEPGEEGPPR